MSIVIELTLRVYPEDGEFVGVCDELDVATQANTPELALQRLNEAIDLHLSALEDVGELFRYLLEHGVKYEASAANSNTITGDSGVSTFAYDGQSTELSPRPTWDADQSHTTCLLVR